jgi:hypothetical protein
LAVLVKIPGYKDGFPAGYKAGQKLHGYFCPTPRKGKIRNEFYKFSFINYKIDSRVSCSKSARKILNAQISQKKQSS